MKRLVLFAFIVAAGTIGCTSKAVKHEVVEVKSESPQLKAAVLPPEADEFSIDHRAYNHYISALLYERLGNLPKAATNYQRALKYHPDSYQFRVALAEVSFRLREYEKAVELLVETTPQDAEVHLILGAAYAALGEDDSARAAYGRLIVVDPNNSMAYSQLASYYRKTGDLDSLIWAYGHLARIRPGNERVWRELGRLQAQRGKFDEARDSFHSSIVARADATNILSFLSLAELHVLNDRPDSAIIVYKQALEVEPYNTTANRELANLYVRLDSLAESVRYARNVVEATPLDRSAVRRLGIIYYGLDSLRLADSVFTSLVDSGERNSINHFYLGRIAALSDDYYRAIDEFTKLTQMADSVAESWLDLGYAYRKSRQAEKEILTYQTGMGHMRDAEGEIRLMFAMGAAYEQNAQIREAEEVFEEIIARSPNHSQSLNYLGYMLADRGERLEYARELIERAVNLAPDNAAYLDSYGWVFYRLEKFDEALVYLKKAVSLDSDPIIFDHLGDAYKAAGDTENARLWWQKALELQPDNSRIKEKLDR
ncbi:MAG: tetratricopeptide repeat protein [Candidatus Zixiibacteriota bacterium]|nr:MAG: tetratricopeptide repeat protein [candidate division Zixibacteria bacterium]